MPMFTPYGGPTIGQTIRHTITQSARKLGEAVSSLHRPCPQISLLIKAKMFMPDGTLRGDIVSSDRHIFLPKAPIQTISLYGTPQKLEIIFSDEQYAVGRVIETGPTRFILIHHLDAMGHGFKEERNDICAQIHAFISPHFSQSGTRKLTARQHVKAFQQVARLISEHCGAAEAKAKNGSRIQLNDDFSVPAEQIECILSLPENHALQQAIKDFLVVGSYTPCADVSAITEALVSVLDNYDAGTQLLMYDSIISKQWERDSVDDINMRLFALYFYCHSTTKITENAHAILEKRIQDAAKCGELEKYAKLLPNTHKNISSAVLKQIHSKQTQQTIIQKLHLIALKKMPANTKGYFILKSFNDAFDANSAKHRPKNITTAQRLEIE